MKKKTATAMASGMLLFAGVAILIFAQARSSSDYQHIFVIIEENRSFQDVIGNPVAPNLTELARQYALATKFFAETHPSQPNYIALLGGDTFRIGDDDAFYCYAGKADENCPNAKKPGYADHTIAARSLMDQLTERGLTWKGYFESIPTPGSKVAFSAETPDEPAQLYASKHNGFMSFATVQKHPNLATKIVGFDRLRDDLISGNLPNYAHIVPNQCNDMHGLGGAKVPNDCTYSNDAGLLLAVTPWLARSFGLFNRPLCGRRAKGWRL
jgi:phospholipase C